MDKFKAWAEDKKNMPIVAGVLLVIVGVAAFVMLKSFGVIGGSGGGYTTTDTTTQTMPNQQPTPPPDQTVAGPVDAGAAGGAGTQPTEPTQAATPGAAPAGGVLQPILPYRKDPFLPFAGMPSRKDAIAMVLPSLRRPRIAPAPVVYEEAQALEADVLPPQPFRRMAGVMWNGKVSAILETAGETDIVKPGTELSRGNSRVKVESITQDSIVLKTLDTKTPMTIVVGMAGSVTGSAATGGEAGGGASMYGQGPYGQ